jgi:hypothetical protein
LAAGIITLGGPAIIGKQSQSLLPFVRCRYHARQTSVTGRGSGFLNEFRQTLRLVIAVDPPLKYELG